MKSLWRGNLALGDAFWNCAVIGGLIVNLSTSIALLILVSFDLVWLGLIVGKGLSLPYNLLAFVGVWRSATQYGGPAFHADLARVTTLALMIVLSLT